ncbi:MAG TPA: gluconate 2-dehydrogenase subunit 3 family protein [Bryobacteraceae bacterium]
MPLTNMSIKRRRFVQSLLLTPAAPVVLAAAQAPPVATPSQPPPAAPAATLPRQRGRQQPTNVPHLAMTQSDLAAKTDQHFFTTEQFATLQKLGSVLMPPLKGNPGALDADAPEFLDFLISVSPADRQKLYRQGLDQINASAQKQFHKPFAELDAAQVDAILRPLLVARYWSEDFPSDPLKNFVAQVHVDIRTATMNSREWFEAAAKSGHRFTRGFNSQAMHWAPIDPIVEG